MAFLFDNPIIIKQARVRLRRTSLFTWVGMLSLLAMGHLWLEFQIGTQRYDRSAGYILGGMIFFLLLIGAQQTGMLVSSTRGSGMLDFHRLSPQSPRSLFAGFLLGGPLREYAVFGVGSVLFLVACAMYGTSIGGAVAILAAVLVLVLLFQGLTIVSAMLARTPTNNAAKGAGAAWGVIIAGMFLGPIFSNAMRVDRLASEPFHVRYYGIRMPWYVLFMGLGLTAFLFFAIASVRRLQDDIRPSLSKKQAIVAFGLAVFAGLGFLATPDSAMDIDMKSVLMMCIFAFWTLLSFLLIPTTAPDRVSYIGGLRRSLRMGNRRPWAFEDRAVNRWAIGALAGILSLGITGATFFLTNDNPEAAVLPGGSSATVVLILLEYGLAIQYFRLRLGKHAGGAMMLFLFVAWVLPVVIGVMVLSSGVNATTDAANGFVVMSVSPFPGVLLGSGILDDTEINSKACQFAALLPALAAVFTFNMMITNLQKRIDRRILPDHQEKDADPFAWLDQATPRELVVGEKTARKKNLFQQTPVSGEPSSESP